MAQKKTSAKKKKAISQQRQLSDKEIEANAAVKLGLYRSVERVILGLAACVTIFGVAYVGLYLPVVASAGKTTVIQNIQQVAATINLHFIIAYSLAAFCTVGWWKEYRKHMDERERKDKRILFLEQCIDPNRTSSGLDVTGMQQISQTE